MTTLYINASIRKNQHEKYQDDDFKSFLFFHIFKVEVWKKADKAYPDLTGPSGRGWQDADGDLEVEWNTEEPLPKELVDILCEADKEPEDDEENFELMNICDKVQEEGCGEN